MTKFRKTKVHVSEDYADESWVSAAVNLPDNEALDYREFANQCLLSASKTNAHCTSILKTLISNSNDDIRNKATIANRKFLVRFI